MIIKHHHSRHKAVMVLCATLIAATIIASTPSSLAEVSADSSFSLELYARFAQTSFPAPPADRALVYIADETNALRPLPFETGATPLQPGAAAKSDKRSYIELKNERAATEITNNVPRFYLFVPDRANEHPPFIVRLANKRGARRVTAMAQRGLRGFAIASEEIIKPDYRVIARDGGMIYMEIRPREFLLPGEYAILGTDLARIATFRLAGASNP